MAGISPTQRTLKALRDRGLKSWVVEKWNSFAKIRQDLFGIIDIISLDPETGVIGVQSTGQDFAGHRRKLMKDKAQECIDWLSVPGTSLELYGWRKLKVRRSGKAMRWKARIARITLVGGELIFVEGKG